MGGRELMCGGGPAGGGLWIGAPENGGGPCGGPRPIGGGRPMPGGPRPRPPKSPLGGPSRGPSRGPPPCPALCGGRVLLWASNWCSACKIIMINNKYVE